MLWCAWIGAARSTSKLLLGAAPSFVLLDRGLENKLLPGAWRRQNKHCRVGFVFTNGCRASQGTCHFGATRGSDCQHVDAIYVHALQWVCAAKPGTALLPPWHACLGKGHTRKCRCNEEAGFQQTRVSPSGFAGCTQQDHPFRFSDENNAHQQRNVIRAAACMHAWPRIRTSSRPGFGLRVRGRVAW